MKKNWIFLRGWGRDSRHWGSFIESFQNEFPHDEIYLLDCPGSGEFSEKNCPASVPKIVDILAARWQEIHSVEKSHIIALSFGGMLAIDWMSRYPEMIDSAIVMNMSAKNWSPFYKRLRYQVYMDFLSLPFQSIRRREEKIIDLTSNLYSSRQSLAELWMAYDLKNPTTKMNVLRQLWAAMHYSLPEQMPKQPILLLNSLADQLVNPSCSEVISKKWSLPLKRHPTAGHDMTLDCPQWVISQILLSSS